MSTLLADLNPLFLPTAKLILADVGDMIAPSTIQPGSTWRTVAEQKTLYNQGITTVLFGWHQVGLGFDVRIYTPAGAYITRGDDWRYRIFGKVAQKHGCIWGGIWSRPDWDHCEFHVGITLQPYRDWHSTHKFV